MKYCIVAYGLRTLLGRGEMWSFPRRGDDCVRPSGRVQPPYSWLVCWPTWPTTYLCPTSTTRATTTITTTHYTTTPLIIPITIIVSQWVSALPLWDDEWPARASTPFTITLLLLNKYFEQTPPSTTTVRSCRYINKLFVVTYLVLLYILFLYYT